MGIGVPLLGVRGVFLQDSDFFAKNNTVLGRRLVSNHHLQAIYIGHEWKGFPQPDP